MTMSNTVIIDKLPKQYCGKVLTDIDESLKIMVPDIDIAEQTGASMTWALTEEEHNLGLVAMGEDDLRRENVHAKWLSQFDVTGFDDIVRIAASFDNGEIAADYTYPVMTITFVSIYGEPKNLENLKQALRDVIPAHIAVNFVFIYMTHSGVGKYTHSQLHGYTHAEIRRGKMNG